MLSSYILKLTNGIIKIKTNNADNELNKSSIIKQNKYFYSKQALLYINKPYLPYKQLSRSKLTLL